MVTIDTAVPGWHSLGLYAAPGETVSVTVPKTAIALNLVVQIGSHTDQLWHLDSWERIPQMVRRFPITEVHTTAASSLGGLIYIDVPDGALSERLAVTIERRGGSTVLSARSDDCGRLEAPRIAVAPAPGPSWRAGT